MRLTIGKRTLAGVALLGLLSIVGPAQALTAEVRDQAGFFKPETVARANEVIKEIKQKYRKDLVVETFRHVPEGKEKEATSSDRKVKARFFADWAIRRARQEGVNGIYVLITREPGHVEVVVGNQTRKVFPDEERDRLAQILLTHFKKKEYDEGLLEAVRHVPSALAARQRTSGVAAPAGSAHAGLPHGQRGAGGGTGWGLWHWVGIGLAVLLGIWVLSAVIRALSGGSQPAYGGAGGPGGSAGYGSGGGGGSFFSGLLGGLFGAAAGSWLYDRFAGGSSPAAAAPPASGPEPEDTDYTAGGDDFNGDDVQGDNSAAGGDFGGGDDFGGGGGGDF
jgi:uncharacterized membrane protein YgcG